MFTSGCDESYYSRLISRASLRLDSEGLAEADPAPEIILKISDPEVRHHYEVCWRNVSRLKNLFAQWGIWHIGLKWTGEADWSLTKRLKQATRACIITLDARGWNTEGANRIWNAIPVLTAPRTVCGEQEGLTPFGQDESNKLDEWFNQEREKAWEKLAAVLEGRDFLQVRGDLSDGLLFLESDAPRTSVKQPKGRRERARLGTRPDETPSEHQDPTPKLDVRDRHFLAAALGLRATDERERCSCTKIGKKADPALTRNQCKTIANKLRCLGYLMSSGEGQSSGYWLTESGKRVTNEA